MNKLQSYNRKLKDAKLGVRIEIRGDRLYLVATLPPKPDSKKTKRHQQRIALHTLANAEGLNHAYDKAKLLGGQLATHSFNWGNWLNIVKTDILTVGDWIEKARESYLDNGGRADTWKNEYLQAYKRLPQGESLTSFLLTSALYDTDPNTRTRRRYALAYAYLCDIAGIEHDFRSKTGSYSPSAVSPRNVPNDVTIANSYLILADHPAWQWVYGMMACYGLRNHEVMFSDLDDFPLCYIFRGKTGGERYAYPLFPEWAEDWRLYDEKRPNISGKTHGDLGHRVSQAFRRYQVNFAPYNLRHARARRGVEFGEDPSFTALQLGHSLGVHLNIYKPWLSLKTTNKAYQDILSNPDRPKPPKL